MSLRPPRGRARHRPGRLRRVRARGRDAGGGGHSLTALLLAPTLLLLIFGGVQFGMQSYAGGLIQAAAQAGARAAAQAPVSAERGQAAAERFLSTKAAGTVSGGRVRVAISGNQVTCTVTGTAQAIVPGIGGPVTRAASMVLQPDLAGTPP